MPVASDRWSRRRARCGGEDGNTLLLMPVGILVVMLLSAIAVDSAIMFTAQRDAQTVADGVARSATGAVDDDGLFDDGVYRVDLARAAQAAQAVLAARPPSELDVACEPPRHGATPDVVEITCEASVDLIFASVLGNDASFRTTATGTARAAQD